MAGYSTERLILCPYTEADLDDLMILWNDPLVRPLVVDDDIALRGQKLKDALHSSMERAAFGVIIRLKTTGEFMGQMMVTVDPETYEGVFGICLSPKFWNNGYGTEATRYMVDYSFRWFDLQRMTLSVWASNTRARAVYKKIGFKIEGRRRGSVRRSNRWEYIIRMGILYEEWAAMNSLRHRYS
ncbi:acyl-CoA N-acyltransferase [Scleroderma citrinum]